MKTLRLCLPFFLALQIISFGLAAPTLAAQQLKAEPVSALGLVDRFSPEELLRLTNAAREDLGIAPLRLDPQLTAAAHAKAADMAMKGYWDHFHDGQTPWDFIQAAGYDYHRAGENLAKGFSSPGGITVAWLKSPAHRHNLLNSDFQDVGFASIESTDPATGQSVLLTVQMFGSR